MMKMEWIVLCDSVWYIQKSVKGDWVHLHYCITPLAQEFYWFLQTRKHKITLFFLLNHSFSSEVFLFPMKNLKFRDHTIRKKIGAYLSQLWKQMKAKDHIINKKVFVSCLGEQVSFHWFPMATTFSWAA